MNAKGLPAARKPARGFTLFELLGAVAILAVLAAIFFPLFVGARSLPNGAVRDGSGKPLPGAVLRFRDPAGRVIATVTADDHGSFRQKGLDGLSHGTVDGFGLSYATRRTGTGTLYVFTPLGTHTATFRDKAGKLIPGFAVSLAPEHSIWPRAYDGPFDAVSDKNGAVQVSNAPVGTRFRFYSQIPNYVIEQAQATVKGNTVRYAVTVITPPP